MEEIKQNKNSSVIFLLFFFLFCLLISPVYADSVNGVDFSDQPLPLGSARPSSSNGLLLYAENNNLIYGVASLEDSYFFVVQSSSRWEWYGVSSSVSRIFLSNGVYRDTDTIDELTNLYYTSGWNPNPSIFVNYCPVFSSLQDGLIAVQAVIDGSGSSSEVYPLNISLPAGNMIIVDISGMDLSRDRYFNAFAHFEYGEPSGTAQNQQWGYWDTIPDNPTLPFAGWESVNWQGVGKRTPLGLYLDFTFQTYIDSNLGHFVYFVNPFRPADSETNDQNPNVDLFFPQASGYRIYELEVLWNSGTGVFGGGADGNTGSGVYDPDTGTWTTINDQTGEPWDPVVGGGNAVSPQTTINAWLQNIANQIKSFFQGSIGAVTTLVGAGSEFFAVVQNLYSWLPSPVLGVLSSALILVITIGVIKVFI